ncbi:protein kinase domain-containing protein [Paraburkholderia strydomiana]|uniref:protein kinase domain-containing protein n=1 Tax=Paraburkholderia strydomiana TaxID=1245417 RepID=UPI00285BD3E2|nr:protein kinase [Paraburkholderia strydomiana]MDR7009667.1 serine/threonine-protein kinase [Paraburkholderia strydomiana]
MSWRENWELDQKHQKKSGGQGSVQKVKNKDTGVVGALKEMHPENIAISERRIRMAREVSALERLAGKGIPKLFESNVQAVEDGAIPLYFVCEWVDGNTLQEVAGGKPATLLAALRLARDLADVVMHCHNSGVLHRDIKPDNIILRNTGDSQVCLVDFGIAYAEEDESGFRTPQRQELGNRFLRLPELGPGGEKRDERADVTHVVGILYFLLTGRAPNVLLDEQARPPQKRGEIEAHNPEAVGDPRWKRVKSIFDVGFSIARIFRFPDAATLIKSLDEAIAYTPELEVGQAPYEKDLEVFNALREQVNAAIKEVELSLIDSVNTLINEIAMIARSHEITYPHPLAKMVDIGREAKMLWSVSHDKSEEPRVFVGIYARLEGEDFGVISVRLQAEAHEQITDDTFVLYSGPAADTSRLLEEIHKRAGEAFGFGVRLLTRKIQRKSL